MNSNVQNAWTSFNVELPNHPSLPIGLLHPQRHLAWSPWRNACVSTSSSSGCARGSQPERSAGHEEHQHLAMLMRNVPFLQEICLICFKDDVQPPKSQSYPKIDSWKVSFNGLQLLLHHSDPFSLFWREWALNFVKMRGFYEDDGWFHLVSSHLCVSWKRWRGCLFCFDLFSSLPKLNLHRPLCEHCLHLYCTWVHAGFTLQLIYSCLHFQCLYFTSWMYLCWFALIFLFQDCASHNQTQSAETKSFRETCFVATQAWIHWLDCSRGSPQDQPVESTSQCREGIQSQICKDLHSVHQHNDDSASTIQDILEMRSLLALGPRGRCRVPTLQAALDNSWGPNICPQAADSKRGTQDTTVAMDSVVTRGSDTCQSSQSQTEINFQAAQRTQEEGLVTGLVTGRPCSSIPNRQSVCGTSGSKVTIPSPRVPPTGQKVTQHRHGHLRVHLLMRTWGNQVLPNPKCLQQRPRKKGFWIRRHWMRWSPHTQISLQRHPRSGSWSNDQKRQHCAYMGGRYQPSYRTPQSCSQNAQQHQRCEGEASSIMVSTLGKDCNRVEIDVERLHKATKPLQRPHDQDKRGHEVSQSNGGGHEPKGRSSPEYGCEGGRGQRKVGNGERQQGDRNARKGTRTLTTMYRSHQRGRSNRHRGRHGGRTQEKTWSLSRTRSCSWLVKIGSVVYVYGTQHACHGHSNMCILNPQRPTMELNEILSTSSMVQHDLLLQLTPVFPSILLFSLMKTVFMCLKQCMMRGAFKLSASSITMTRFLHHFSKWPTRMCRRMLLRPFGPRAPFPICDNWMFRSRSRSRSTSSWPRLLGNTNIQPRW